MGSEQGSECLPLFSTTSTEWRQSLVGVFGFPAAFDGCICPDLWTWEIGLSYVGVDIVSLPLRIIGGHGGAWFNNPKLTKEIPSQTKNYISLVWWTKSDSYTTKTSIMINILLLLILENQKFAFAFKMLSTFCLSLSIISNELQPLYNYFPTYQIVTLFHNL